MSERGGLMSGQARRRQRSVTLEVPAHDGMETA